MNVIGAIIAGLVGTGVMTALMYVAPRMGMPKMDILGMPGSMFTADEAAATRFGAVIHFMVGAVFGIIYALVWNAGVGSINLLWGIIFGVLHGVVATVAMPLMMNMHPRPPQSEGGMMTILGQLMGHAVFGLVVALIYATF